MCIRDSLEFVRYVMSVDPERKRNRYGKGKYLPVSYTHLDVYKRQVIDLVMEVAGDK